MLIGRFGFGLQCTLGRPQLYHNPGQPLRQRVVNLARQPGALLQRGGFAPLIKQPRRLRFDPRFELAAQLLERLGLGAALLERALQAAGQQPCQRRDCREDPDPECDRKVGLILGDEQWLRTRRRCQSVLLQPGHARD